MSLARGDQHKKRNQKKKQTCERKEHLRSAALKRVKKRLKLQNDFPKKTLKGGDDHSDRANVNSTTSDDTGIEVSTKRGLDLAHEIRVMLGERAK